MAATDAQVRDFINKNFPAYSYLLGAAPDVMEVFRKAIDPLGNVTESGDQLLAQLQATGWWKAHGTSLRQFMTLEQTDPATLNEQIRAKDAEVHQTANSLGLSDNQINIDQVARDAIRFGWTNAELQEQLAGMATFNANAPATSNIGAIDNAMSTLKQQAAQYWVTLDDNTAFQWARQIAAGHQSEKDYTPILADWAKGKFPSLAQYIDKGLTPSNFIQPMQREAAQLLEVQPDQIDFNNPTFSRMLDYADPKTGERRLMTAAEQQAYIRSTDQWAGTKQGQASVADMTEGLLSIFKKTPSGGASFSGPGNAF
jgi:hypothetical protein